MKTSLAILCGLAGLALATAAFGQENTTAGGPGRGPHGMGPGGHGFPPPVMALLDTDKDGVLSATEIAAAPEVLTKLNTTDDGVLTQEEICAGCAAARDANCPAGGQGKGLGKGKGKGPGGDPFLMKLLDADKSGTISLEEVTNASAALLKLDKNGDGQLTPEELRPRDGRGHRGPPPAEQAPAQE